MHRLLSVLGVFCFCRICYNMCTQKSPYNWSEQLYIRHGEVRACRPCNNVLPVQFAPCVRLQSYPYISIRSVGELSLTF